jgi:hypothetical protein
VELTSEDVAVLLGKTPAAVRWLRTTGQLTPRRRNMGRGGRGGGLCSYSAVVRFLRGNDAQAGPRETDSQRQRRARRDQELAIRACGGERVDPPRPTKPRPQSLIALYLTTHRTCCAAIAADGFEGERYGPYGPGVYLLEAPVLRHRSRMIQRSDRTLTSTLPMRSRWYSSSASPMPLPPSTSAADTSTCRRAPQLRPRARHTGARLSRSRATGYMGRSGRRRQPLLHRVEVLERSAPAHRRPSTRNRRAAR